MPLSDADKKAKRAKAEAVLERARKGEDFAALATAFSEDPGMKDNKGEYKFARAKDDARRAMVPEFETTAFALKTNEISGIVTTEYGYHIIKLHEIIPARKVPFAEARERIHDFFMQSALEKQMPTYFAAVKKEAGVEITDEKLKTVMEKAEKEREENSQSPTPGSK
jgi:parvulin-like peptidyl-prolyl isomerase